MNGFECKCDKGFEGLTCEININECYSLPCENHGICTDLIDGYNCECPPGYQGVTCHEDIDECQSEPCLNMVRHRHRVTCQDYAHMCQSESVGMCQSESVDMCRHVSE